MNPESDHSMPGQAAALAGRATVLLGHGSRDPAWQGPLQAVRQRMAQREPGHPVALAFLELCPPDLDQALAPLLAGGARQITVVPMFLGLGRHVREDLPRRMASLQARHPQIVFSLQPAVGEAPELIEVLTSLALR